MSSGSPRPGADRPPVDKRVVDGGADCDTSVDKGNSVDKRWYSVDKRGWR